MGIGKGPAILLMKESLRAPFKGSFLTLGKQTVSISPYQLEYYAKLAGVSWSAPKGADRFAPMQDNDFFSFLGFSEIHSLDYSSYEGASIQFDLNSGDLPEKYRDAFDVIYDGGTLEHVFHLPNALKTLAWMLKPGGRIIHLCPASNHLEHSFYMFSPTLFYDFYQSNHFDINYIQIVRYTSCFDYKWVVYDYHPGCFKGTDIGSGGLDNGMYMVHTVATKTAQSTGDRIPNQNMYENDMWIAANRPAAPPPKKITLNKWKQRFKKSPVYPLWAFIKLKMRKHGVPLKPSGRF